MSTLSPITLTSFSETIADGSTKRIFTSNGVNFTTIGDVHVYKDDVEILNGFRKTISVNPGPVTINFDNAPTPGVLTIRYDTTSTNASIDFRNSTSGVDPNKEFFRAFSLVKVVDNKLTADVKAINALIDIINRQIGGLQGGIVDHNFDEPTHTLTLIFGDGTSERIDFSHLSPNTHVNAIRVTNGRLYLGFSDSSQPELSVGLPNKFVNDSDWETNNERLVLRWNDGLFATAQHIPITDYVDAARLKPFNNTQIYTSPDIFYWFHDGVMYMFRVRNGQTFQASVDAPTFETGRDTQYYSDTDTNANAKLELIANLSDFASFSDIRPVVTNGQLRIGVVYKNRFGAEVVFNSTPVEVGGGNGLTDEEGKHLAAVTDLVIRREVKFIGQEYDSEEVPALASGVSGALSLKQQNPPRIRFVYAAAESKSAIDAAFLGKTMTITIDKDQSISLDVLAHENTLNIGSGYHAEEYSVGLHEYFHGNYQLQGKDISVYLPPEKDEVLEIDDTTPAADKVFSSARTQELVDGVEDDLLGMEPDWLKYFDRYYATSNGIDTNITGAGQPVATRGATFANGVFTFTSTLGSSVRLPDELSAKMASAEVTVFGTIAHQTGTDLHPILFESGSDGRPLLTQWKGGSDYLNLYGPGPQVRLSANGTFPNDVDIGVGAVLRETTATGWINGEEQTTATVSWGWEADDRPTLGENNTSNTNGNFVGTQKQMIFLTTNSAYDSLSASAKTEAVNGAAKWATTNDNTKMLDMMIDLADLAKPVVEDVGLSGHDLIITRRNAENRTLILPFSSSSSSAITYIADVVDGEDFNGTPSITGKSVKIIDGGSVSFTLPQGQSFGDYHSFATWGSFYNAREAKESFRFLMTAVPAINRNADNHATFYETINETFKVGVAHTGSGNQLTFKASGKEFFIRRVVLYKN